MTSSLRPMLVQLLVQGTEGVRCRDQLQCGATTAVGRAEGFDRLNEASSLAIGIKDSKYLYTAHDNGNPDLEVFAMEKASGKVAKVFKVTGVRNERHGGGGRWGDHECITVHACPHAAEKTCIYLGDTGYNWARGSGGEARDYPQSFIVFEEPTIDGVDGGEIQVQARRFPFLFPEGRLFDVEACTVHKGEIHLFTKNKKRGYEFSEQYKFQAPEETETDRTTKMTAPVVTLTSEGQKLYIQFGEIAGATSTGEGILLRTSKGIYVVDPANKTCSPNTKEPCYVQFDTKGLAGIQEAIAYEKQGEENVLYTYGEEANPTLYKTVCTGSFFVDAKVPTATCQDNPGEDSIAKQAHGKLEKEYRDEDAGSGGNLRNGGPMALTGMTAFTILLAFFFQP